MARTSNTTGGAKREMDMFAGVLVGVRYETKIIMYDDGKYLIGGYETALYSKMLFEEIFG